MSLADRGEDWLLLQDLNFGLDDINSLTNVQLCLVHVHPEADDNAKTTAELTFYRRRMKAQSRLKTSVSRHASLSQVQSSTFGDAVASTSSQPPSPAPSNAVMGPTSVRATGTPQLQDSIQPGTPTSLATSVLARGTDSTAPQPVLDSANIVQMRQEPSTTSVTSLNDGRNAIEDSGPVASTALTSAAKTQQDRISEAVISDPFQVVSLALDRAPVERPKDAKPASPTADDSNQRTATNSRQVDAASGTQKAEAIGQEISADLPAMEKIARSTPLQARLEASAPVFSHESGSRSVSATAASIPQKSEQDPQNQAQKAADTTWRSSSTNDHHRSEESAKLTRSAPNASTQRRPSPIRRQSPSTIAPKANLAPVSKSPEGRLPKELVATLSCVFIGNIPGTWSNSDLRPCLFGPKLPKPVNIVPLKPLQGSDTKYTRVFYRDEEQAIKVQQELEDSSSNRDGLTVRLLSFDENKTHIIWKWVEKWAIEVLESRLERLNKPAAPVSAKRALSPVNRRNEPAAKRTASGSRDSHDLAARLDKSTGTREARELDYKQVNERTGYRTATSAARGGSGRDQDSRSDLFNRVRSPSAGPSTQARYANGNMNDRQRDIMDRFDGRSATSGRDYRRSPPPARQHADSTRSTGGDTLLGRLR